MQNPNKPFFVLLAISLLVCGCNDYLTGDAESLQVLSTKASLDDDMTLLYHTPTSKWIVRADDPYRLDNVKDVINRTPYLKEGLSILELPATHYVLTLYPRTEKERETIEHLNDVSVSYIPFDYKIVSRNNDTERVSIADTTFYSSYEKYSVEEAVYDGEGNLLYTKTKPMPVLYVVWPVNKDLPKEYDYQIEYSVFLPQKSELYCSNKQTLDKLEKELITCSQWAQSGTRGYRYFQGYFNKYDPRLYDYIPVENLRLRFSVGSNVIEGYTNSSGYFNVYAPENAAIFIVYQSDKWKMFMDTDSSESPIMISYAILSDVWVNGDTITMTSKLPTIHSAANYYYNHNHGIPIDSNTSIRIRISDSYDGEHSGQFHPGLLGSSCIDISTYVYSNEDLFATVCHELGHFNHYLIRGGFINYTSVHRLFKESYAQYSGWFVCRYYYIAHNLPNSSLWLIPRSSQTWKKTESGNDSHYSPLFVDLIDDHNQHEDTNYKDRLYLNDDTISNVPHTVIAEMIENRIWSQIKDVLDDYCNVYFTQSQYNQFVAPYDYYFLNN
jgi:hypothetical protein